jgi:hypothetical protein
MLKKSKIRAEELLAEENYSEELLLQNAKDGNVDEKEISIARKIYSFLRSVETRQCLVSTEKDQTKNQIRASVRKLYTRKLLVRWSVAATILFAVILTSVLYFQVNSTTEIVNFAQTLTNIKAENNTLIYSTPHLQYH